MVYISFKEFYEKCGKNITYSYYYGVYKAIDIEWKRIIKGNEQPGIAYEVMLQKVLMEKNPVQFICNKLIWKNNNLCERKLKWERVLGIDISMERMYKYFGLIWVCTNDNKLRSFQ